jgi:hypothetical protein
MTRLLRLVKGHWWWLRHDRTADTAVHMGGVLSWYADRFTSVQARTDAHEREVNRQEWEQLSADEQAYCHAELHRRIAAGLDPMWMTGPERHLYDRAVREP